MTHRTARKTALLAVAIFCISVLGSRTDFPSLSVEHVRCSAESTASKAGTCTEGLG